MRSVDFCFRACCEFMTDVHHVKGASYEIIRAVSDGCHSGRIGLYFEFIPASIQCACVQNATHPEGKLASELANCHNKGLGSVMNLVRMKSYWQ